jgi:hypothetical protein
MRSSRQQCRELPLSAPVSRTAPPTLSSEAHSLPTDVRWQDLHRGREPGCHGCCNVRGQGPVPNHGVLDVDTPPPTPAGSFLPHRRRGLVGHRSGRPARRRRPVRSEPGHWLARGRRPPRRRCPAGGCDDRRLWFRLRVRFGVHAGLPAGVLPASPGPVASSKCDPAGGDLAARFGLSSLVGWPSLTAAVRPDGFDSASDSPHLRYLPGGLPVLVACRARTGEVHDG